MVDVIPSYRSPDDARRRLVSLCGNVTNMHVLDVGCGDGSIGRALLPATGPHGSVTFIDRDPGVISSLASDLHSDPHARALVDDAVTLRTVPDHSIDMVVMRAVLLYIPDKHAALASAARVLGPEARIIISEPVNRPFYHPAERFWGFDLSTIPDVAYRIQAGYTRDAPASVRAMSDWDDVDLARILADAGFSGIRMETTTEIDPGPPLPWLAFIHAKWTPWMPSLAEVMRDALPAEERLAFEAVVRPQLAEGNQRLVARTTFITAHAAGARSTLA